MAWLQKVGFDSKKTFVCVFLLSSALVTLYLQKDAAVRIVHDTSRKISHVYFSKQRFHQKDEHGSVNQVIQTTLAKRCKPVGEDNMYTFGSEVYDAIGETELQQYIRFKKYNPKFKFSMNKIKVAKPPARYSYHVEALSSTDILIEERNGKVPTGGGSSFLVRSDSVSTQICHYDDFFNGTYVVHCPLPECTCRNISVWLQHANYTAYTCVHYPIGKLLWRKRSCNLHKGNAGFTKTSRKMKTSSNGKNIVTWYLENRLWITRSVSGKKYTEMRKPDVCGCIRKIRKLFCFGASHMRYKSAYIASTCYNVPANVTVRFRSLTVENIRFRTVTKIYQYPELWKKYLKNETLGQRDVVLVQTGAHDMEYGGMQQTMDMSVMKLVRVLSDLQMKSLKYGF